MGNLHRYPQRELGMQTLGDTTSPFCANLWLWVNDPVEGKCSIEGKKQVIVKVKVTGIPGEEVPVQSK